MEFEVGAAWVTATDLEHTIKGSDGAVQFHIAICNGTLLAGTVRSDGAFIGGGPARVERRGATLVFSIPATHSHFAVADPHNALGAALARIRRSAALIKSERLLSL
jgi:hypothetical protein